jgi:hypothetical protein
MNEQIVQMGPMWVLGGISAGWLAEASMYRLGYGLVVDIGLGVGASLAGGAVLLALAGLPAGMFVMFAVGFVLATGVILVQRLCWPCEPGARERNAHLRLTDLCRPSRGAAETASGLGDDSDGRTGRPTPTHALARLATTGIYLLRGVPIDVQRAARIRAAREETTLRQVLLRSLGEYAAGTWTPQADELAGALNPPVHATGR